MGQRPSSLQIYELLFKSKVKMSNNLDKDFQMFLKKVDATMRKLPVLVANTALNFVLDNFRSQSWNGNTTEPWKPRKFNKKRSGAALLVKSGRLKRANRVKQADWNRVLLVNDTPYAGVHNEGNREVQTINEHSRTASRKVSTKIGKKGKGLKSGQIKIRGKGHQVSSHTRHQNIPRRQFMGNSPILFKRIDRVITAELMKINNK